MTLPNDGSRSVFLQRGEPKSYPFGHVLRIASVGFRPTMTPLFVDPERVGQASKHTFVYDEPESRGENGFRPDRFGESRD